MVVPVRGLRKRPAPNLGSGGRPSWAFLPMPLARRPSSVEPRSPDLKEDVMNIRASAVRGPVWAAVVVAAGISIATATAARTHHATATRAPAAHGAVPPSLVADVAQARAATARYVSNLALAKADGYTIITKMIPNMGYHYMNPNVKGFDVRKPPILVYEHQGSTWQLGAVEWVFTSQPATPPLPGASYGSFGAGCHYVDGSYVPAAAQSDCPTTAPETGATFSFWHPLLVTMHLWIWYPNPSGLFASTNPLVAPFNGD
jgi:hypothetical protein